MPEGRARDWHNALMDYGSLVQTVEATGIKPVASQSKFKGSMRDYRGRILKFLTKEGKGKRELFLTHCAIPEEKIEEVLQVLVKDGLIEPLGKDEYQLPL